MADIFRKHSLEIFFAVFCLCALWAVNAVAEPGGEQKVTVCGTGDSQDLLRILATEFHHSHPEIDILVPESIGSSAGIRATAEGKCDLGRTARPIREKEKKYELGYQVFCFSPVAIAVHPGIGRVSNLTGREVADIFSGRITNWLQVGGEDQPIYVATREKGDSCRTVLEEKLPGFGDIESFAGEKLYSTPEMVQVIGRYAGTVGYVPLAMTQNTNVRVLSVDGVVPSPVNIRSGRYPYTVPLGLVWRQELSKAARIFMDYLFSPETRHLVEQYGAIPAL